MVVRVVERKERSDKKREVKPVLAIEVKDAIYRISHITHTPIKDVCEYLTVFALRDKETIDILSKHLKRSIAINNTYYRGDLDAPTIRKRLRVPTDLITVKFIKTDYEIISALAYALDVTPTRVTAILLTSASRNIKAVNAYVREYMLGELTNGQMRELREVLTYVNRYNNDISSWVSLLSTIVGDIRPATKKLREMVEDFFIGK